MAGSRYHKNRHQKSSRADLIKRAILIREKKSLETHFDFLNCKITKGLLIVKGVCKPTDQSPEYHYTLTYDGVKPPRVIVDEPQMEYNDEIHLFPLDNALCLYHAETDDLLWDSRNHNLYDTIIPWTQEWFVYYELYNITGKWEHPHINHRLNKLVK
jgi:hypothetical protein